jgi:type I restriction enzyme S subunit
MGDVFEPPWPTAPLGRLCSRVSARNTVGETNVLTISAEEGLIRQDDYFKRVVASSDLSTYSLLAKGDFAYNKSYSNGYPVGAIRRLDRYATGVVSPLYICFRPASREIDPDFLRHYFAAGRVDASIGLLAKEGARNHGLLNVALDDFFGIPVARPPIWEQRRIARILDTADLAIQSKKALITKLQQVERGLLHDLMTRGINNRGALRDLAKAREFGETPLGRLPKTWAIARLQDFCEIRSGSTPPRQSSFIYYSDDGVPWVKTLDLNEGRLVDTEEHVTPLALKHASCPLLSAGTVLVAMYGGWAQIGRTALLDTAATTNQAICGLSIRDNTLPLFLLRALQHGRSRWKAVAASTRKDPNITKQDVANFLVPLPSRHEQLVICECFDEHLAVLRRETSELQKLLLLQRGLMDDLLTGRVRVSGDEDSV